MKKNIFINSGPEGSNKLSTRASFVQRVVYESAFSEIRETLSCDFFDLRLLNSNFLKYDLDENIINVSETRLKDIATEIYAVDFVADAFSELQSLCANNSKISEEKLKNLQAKKGWSSFHNKYHQHATAFFDQYIKYITSSARNKKIIDFKDFIVSFVHFLDRSAHLVPFLKSSFMLSGEYSATDGGFVIEFDITVKDDDKTKFDKYYKTNSYVEFAKLCKQTNFAIDKNCPWRLVYNIYSDASEKYMKRYDINREDFVDQYFYKTQEHDIENLKHYMIMFYNTFVGLQPTSSNPKIINYNNRSFTIPESIERALITKQEVDNKFSNLFWFNIYCHISFVENKSKIGNKEYKTTLKNLADTYKMHGTDLAMKDLSKYIISSEKTDNHGEYYFTLPDLT